MTSYYVVIEENHPLKEIINNAKIPRGPSPSSCPRDHVLVDLRILSFEDRLDDLEGFPGVVIADGTTGFKKEALVNFPQIKALIPLAFYSPTSTYEVWTSENQKETCERLVLDFLTKLNFKAHFTKTNVNYSFILPRIGAMLINEFLYAKEETLATNTDMDLALKFGVNYPLGAFEWKNKSSLEALAYLLYFLEQQKQSQRYQLSDEFAEEL